MANVRRGDNEPNRTHLADEIQRRNVDGHKPWLVIFVFSDGRAKIVASYETQSSARRYVRKVAE